MGPREHRNYLAAGQNGGQFFINDGHKTTGTTDTVVMSYQSPTKELSFELVDVDFSEVATIRAFDGKRNLIDEETLESPSPDFR